MLMAEGLDRETLSKALPRLRVTEDASELPRLVKRGRF